MAAVAGRSTESLGIFMNPRDDPFLWAIVIVEMMSRAAEAAFPYLLSAATGAVAAAVAFVRIPVTKYRNAGTLMIFVALSVAAFPIVQTLLKYQREALADQKGRDEREKELVLAFVEHNDAAMKFASRKQRPFIETRDSSGPRVQYGLRIDGLPDTSVIVEVNYSTPEPTLSTLCVGITMKYECRTKGQRVR
jgi:hypothetical protein